MYCRKCGEDNPDNAVFCRNCGERLVEEVIKAVSGFEAKEQIKNKYGSSNVTIINCKDLKFGWMV